MIHSSKICISLLAATALLTTSCGSGGSVSNASPRITEVPQQATLGGAAFTIDLSTYVSDREGASLTYAVTAGGGAFTGSSYTHTFDTMGEYEVAFEVGDGSKTEPGTFNVRVTSANFAVVREDSAGLLLVDTATNAMLRVAGSTATPSLAAGLASGRMVYQIAAGNGQQLWMFDPLTRANTRIAATKTGDVTYRAKTSDDKVVYTTGTGNTQELWFYNPVTGVSRALAQDVPSSVTVLVNTDDIVYFEAAVEGQADVFGYDPEEDEVFTVGDAATSEQVQAVLPNGGLVFSRIGDTGESDLWHYLTSAGLVSVGGDFNNIGDDDKTFNGNASASQVIFTADSGSATEIYVWDPADGQTYGISTLNGAGANNQYVGIANGDEMVYTRFNGGGDYDAYLMDIDSLSAATLLDSSDNAQVLAVTRDSSGGVGWAFVLRDTDDTNLLAISLISTPATVTWAAGTAVSTTVNVLANGDVVALAADGTALNIFDTSAGTWGTVITDTGLSFGGNGLETGDFVYSLTATAQTDLSMWDASATSSVVVSSTAGNDVFQALTLDSTILFTRVIGTNTNADLFTWNGTTETQLTDEDAAEMLHDHAVLGTFAGTR
ncbi:MAG: Tol biopolymer transport system component [Planctomycetota bacterium]|jgi:Tol biopolymer transport system component